MGTVPTPTTFVAGTVATAANLNTLRDCVNFGFTPPMCSAYQANAQTLTNAVATAIILDGETYDVVQSGDSPMHDNVTANTKVYVRTTGKYTLLGSICFSSNVTGPRVALIKANGTTNIVTQSSNAVSGASTTMQVGPIVWPLTAGDYIELIGTQTSGGNLALNAVFPGPSFLQVTFFSS